MGFPRWGRWLTVVVMFAGCVYQTDRTQGIHDGEIRATVHRPDGSPAKGALVAVAGSNRVVAAGADGSFTIADLVPGTWLLHVTEDDEGDGVAERAAWLSATTKFVPVPKNLTDGCIAAPPPAVTSVLLGNVTLAPTLHVKGTVVLPAAALGQRVKVVVWRDVDGHASPVEAAAFATADGSFDVGGVAPGAVHVAALAWDPLEDARGTKATTFGVAGNVNAGDDDVAITADQSARTAADPTKLRTFPVELAAQWDTPSTAAVDVTSAFFLAPDDDDGTPLASDDTGWPLDDSTRSLVLDAPAGVVDIALESGTDGAAGNTLRGALALPDVAVLGPLELPVLADSCDDGNGGRDCDHDGLAGLPLPSDDPADPVRVQYGKCAQECASAFGAKLPGATCTVDGKNIDCDDDGDGQPDVTEPPHCLGPGRGTDLDADGACEPTEDPAPWCASNDPSDPACGTFDKPPPQYAP